MKDFMKHYWLIRQLRHAHCVNLPRWSWFSDKSYFHALSSVSGARKYNTAQYLQWIPTWSWHLYLSFVSYCAQCLAVNKMIWWEGGKPLSQEVIFRQSQCLISPPTAQWDRTACVITSRADNSSVPTHKFQVTALEGRRPLYWDIAMAVWDACVHHQLHRAWPRGQKLVCSCFSFVCPLIQHANVSGTYVLSVSTK